MIDFDRTEKVVARVVARFARRVWWARSKDVQDDMRQAAWLIALESMRRFDPNVGVPWEGYLERALVVSLPNQLWQLSSPASASKNKRKHLAGRFRASAEDSQGEDKGSWVAKPAGQYVAHEIEHQPDWVDKLLADKQWLARARRALSEIVLSDREVALGVEFVMAKEDAEEGVPSTTFAAKKGVDVSKVYQAAYKARQAISKDRELYELILEKREK